MIRVVKKYLIYTIVCALVFASIGVVYLLVELSDDGDLRKIGRTSRRPVSLIIPDERARVRMAQQIETKLRHELYRGPKVVQYFDSSDIYFKVWVANDNVVIKVDNATWVRSYWDWHRLKMVDVLNDAEAARRNDTIQSVYTEAIQEVVDQMDQEAGVSGSVVKYRIN